MSCKKCTCSNYFLQHVTPFPCDVACLGWLALAIPLKTDSVSLGIARLVMPRPLTIAVTGKALKAAITPLATTRLLIVNAVCFNLVGTLSVNLLIKKDRMYEKPQHVNANPLAHVTKLQFKCWCR